VTQIEGKQVFEVIMKDEEFKSQPENVIKAIEPFVLALPEILKDQLSSIVTVTTLLNAKLAFLKYCMENDYIKKVTDEVPDDNFGMFGRESMVAISQAAVEQSIQAIPQTINKLAEILASQGLSEEQVLFGGENPIMENLRSDYKNGTLTIGDLLLKQPMAIVKNA